MALGMLVSDGVGVRSVDGAMVRVADALLASTPTLAKGEGECELEEGSVAPTIKLLGAEAVGLALLVAEPDGDAVETEDAVLVEDTELVLGEVPELLLLLPPPLWPPPPKSPRV